MNLRRLAAVCRNCVQNKQLIGGPKDGDLFGESGVQARPSIVPPCTRRVPRLGESDVFGVFRVLSNQ
jgi:hypothetical protein